MTNNMMSLLTAWYPQRDQAQWVLVTIYKTSGPAYRKAGSMMLFSSEGHQLGMLSGGCLETDISRNARRVMASNKAMTLTYDSQDEDDLSFHLGIGCGGTVWMMLQPINAGNNYLELAEIYQVLTACSSGYYYQQIPESLGDANAKFIVECSKDIDYKHLHKSEIKSEGEAEWLQTFIQPPPHLLIAGGGLDARPLATLGHHLGWRISVWDPRPANGRREHFQDVDMLLKDDPETLKSFVDEQRVNAVVIMNHHVELDAKVLSAVNASGLSYLAVLGPVNRRAKVLNEAGLDETQCQPRLAGPAGLDLGADLPETIALSILAECQACLTGRSGRSISDVLMP